MMAILYHLIRFLIGLTLPSEVIERENFIREFNNNFEISNCEEALKYFEAFDKTNQAVPLAIRIKAADCYYILRDTAKMKLQLNKFDKLNSNKYKSVIYNQKASLAAYNGDTLEAINLLKMAIETENNNNFVKRNYELLRKLYKPNDNNPPPNGQSSSNQSKSQDGGKISNSNEKEDELENVEPPEIARSQALQLLDAIRSEEYNKLPMLFDAKSDTLDYGNW
jgi:hypothetical protein